MNGDTAKAAERALKEKLAERSLFQPASTTLTPDSPFPDLVANWLADIGQEDQISKTTRFLYKRNMRTLVLPVFESLTLREIGVALCGQFTKMLAQQSFSRAEQARVALRLALELAVRHEVLPRNPRDHVARLHREARLPDALTLREVNAIRAVIGRSDSGIDHISGPKPDGQLGARLCSAPPPSSARRSRHRHAWLRDTPASQSRRADRPSRQNGCRDRVRHATERPQQATRRSREGAG